MSAGKDVERLVLRQQRERLQPFGLGPKGNRLHAVIWLCVLAVFMSTVLSDVIEAVCLQSLYVTTTNR